MKLKILLVSRPVWDNKKGNTYSNFFQEFENVEFAQVYCRDELPDNDLCKKYYRISERQLVKSILSSTFAGSELSLNEIIENPEIIEKAEKEKGLYDFFRNYRFTFFLWFRELIWIFGKWKSPELKNFIEEFKPDIIYTEAYDTFYTYKLLKYVISIAKVPYVLFHCDDQVSFRKFSISPFFWINRLILRKYVNESVRLASINYSIIDEQKRVYENIFKREFKILNKCVDFKSELEISTLNNPIRIVFAGNLFHGRWKTLSKLANAIKNINNVDTKIIFEIYTGNHVSDKIRRKIQIHNSIQIKGYLPYNQLIDVQRSSDILLHVESFNIKERLITYLSFSTKIVDFFELGKCILAIGWQESAPIKYLKDKDAAIVVNDLKILESSIEKILLNKNLINEYAEKAYACGKKFHKKDVMLNSFRNDLYKLSNKLRN